MLDSGVIEAMNTREFSAILDADAELRALEAEKNPRRDVTLELMQFLGCKTIVSGIQVSPITPALWALWWLLDLPFARNRQQVNELDLDVALYTLGRGTGALDATLQGIVSSSSGTCSRKGIDPIEAEEDIWELCRLAFRPIQMLPPSGKSEKSDGFDFDLAWLTRLTAATVPVMGISAREIANRPLNEVYYYYLWRIKQDDPKLEIERRAPSELCELIMARVEILGVKYYEETRKNGN